MPDKHLHIVSFDVPVPPDYGGVIDVFFKLRALHSVGVKVHLHCFEYGRGEAKELLKYASEVHYYKRGSGVSYLLSSVPYIAATRASDELVKNLLKDKYPILFEGLHCCYHLHDERLANRIRLVRMHNIEHEYYAHLAKLEKNIFKRYYLDSESKKLKWFEQKLQHATRILAISPSDAASLASRYKNVECIPAFHPNDKVIAQEGTSDFALYHGNLKVAENNEAAMFLVKEVFDEPGMKLVIAGNSASDELKAAVKARQHIRLKEGLTTENIHQLIRTAQVNVLPTFQATGIKLKLLAALFEGRHCLVNGPMVENTGLETLCTVKQTGEEMKQELKRLMSLPFGAEEKRKREEVLYAKFSNKLNAEKLASLLSI